MKPQQLKILSLVLSLSVYRMTSKADFDTDYDVQACYYAI